MQQYSECHHLTYQCDNVFRLTKFVQIRTDMGLTRTRQQGHTIETIREAMIELHQMYPNAGAREVIGLLFHEKNMSVSRSAFCQFSFC